MTNAADDFQRYAGDYDQARRRLVVRYDEFYGAAVAGARLVQRPVRRVLDLGAGTGILSSLMRDAHPGAELTLLDAAPAMLDRARAALPGARIVEGDLRGPLPAGPFDAVVSALAIHHLEHPEQRDLYARIHAVLEPGGVFVNAEQVAGPTPELDAAYLAWHEAAARAKGTGDAEWAAALGRFESDRCASTEAGLAWLRAAGFAHADAPWRDGRFAVFVAVR